MNKGSPRLLLLTSLEFLLSALAWPAQGQVPVVVSADPRGNPNGITIKFSQPMDGVSSDNPAHYALTNAVLGGVPVTNASLAADLVTVQLSLGTSLRVGSNYTLTVANIASTNGILLSPNPTLVNIMLGGAITYSFDDGTLPSGTSFPTASDGSGNTHNPGAGVTATGGYNNSGMLVMTVPQGSVQTFAQWQLPDLATGQRLTNLNISFNAFLGGGSGNGNAVRFPPAGGNGMLFHWGPGLLYQYTGSASSFGQGLDVTFRTYYGGSGPNTMGINVYYGGTTGAGNNTPVATKPFMDYYRGDSTSFTSNTWVNLNIAVTNSSSATNAILNLICSNSWNGLTNIYTNLVITNFIAPLTNHTMAFTATDGSGAHEYCMLDSVDFTVNGAHIPGTSGIGPVGFTQQPASQSVAENVQVTFNVGVTGAPPLTFLWMSNGVPIAGAVSSSYTTPPTSYAMNGTAYSVAVSNAFSGALSSNAILTILRYPVTIFSQPRSQTVPSGSTANFATSIDPASTGPINYQWWRISGSLTNPIAGATSPLYTTPPLSVSDSGSQFYTVVSGALNVATSSVATVTVLPPPQIGPPQLSPGGTNLTLNWSNGGTLLAATNLAGPWSWVPGGTNSPFTIPIGPNIPQRFFRVQQFGIPAGLQDYTPYVNMVQNDNGGHSLNKTVLMRYPLGRIGAWSVAPGEFADCVTRSLRLYPCLDSIVNKGTTDWRSSISGDPSLVNIVYQTGVPAGGSSVDLTVTPHVSAFRYHFMTPTNFQAVALMANDLGINNNNWTSNYLAIIDNRTIQVTLTGSSLRAYYYIKFSAPNTGYGTINGSTVSDGATSVGGAAIGGYFKFAVPQVLAAVAVSHTSMAQAQAFFYNEFPAMDFDGAVANLKNAWMTRLAKVEAQGSFSGLQLFYTALYTVYVNVIDATDNLAYTNHQPLLTIASSDYWQAVESFLRCDWDMSRGVYPLVALIDPDLFAQILSAYQVQYDHDGRFCPNWDPYAGWCYRNSLYLANFSTLALQAGITGVDYTRLKNSLTNHVQNNYLPEMFADGFVPVNNASGDVNSGSRTLEYCTQLQGLAILSKVLGDLATYNLYYHYRTNYLNLWDATDLQFRAKNADGSWATAAGNIGWTGSGFFEGNGIDYTFCAPHDPYGIVNLYGPAAANAISNYTRSVSDFNDYKLIYEYLPIFADRADLTQNLVRTAHVSKFTTPTMYEGFSGSSGWGDYYTDNAGPLACCMLGLYWIPTSGGTWMITTPSLDSAVIHGKTDITVQTFNSSPTNNYLNAIQLNGAAYPSFLISAAALTSGAQTFVLSASSAPARIGNLYLSSTDGEVLSADTDGASYLDFFIDPLAASCRAQVYSTVQPASITLNGSSFTNWSYDSSTKLAILTGVTRGAYRVNI